MMGSSESSRNVAFPSHGGGRTTAASNQPTALDAQIIERCIKQDAMAFRAFVVRYERMVFALLSRMLGAGSASDVEDLAQETFVRAYRAFPTFDPKGPAKASTWLLTIATRLALDLRKRKRIDVKSLDDDGGGDDGEKKASPPGANASTGSTPEISLERRQLGQAIADAAAKLPDDQRAALVLAEIHGLSILEIAEALEVPENTAKTRLFRAREKMRAALATEWRSET